MPCDLEGTYCPNRGFPITEPGPGEWHCPHAPKEALTLKNILKVSVVLIVLNLSASWLLLVEMNKDANPEASLEDFIRSYPGSSRPSFSFLFFLCHARDRA